MSLPKLPREPIRPEKEPDVDNDIWLPEWKCFCCHDYGRVSPHLASLVIPDYDHWKDKPPACQRCSKGSDKVGSFEYDQRFNRSICNELDKIERDNWTQTIKSQQKHILDLKKLALSRTMPGAGERTANDEREIRQRKQEIEAISHEKWLAMSNEYLGKEEAIPQENMPGGIAHLGGEKQ